jgi:hypothetical protein
LEREHLTKAVVQELGRLKLQADCHKYAQAQTKLGHGTSGSVDTEKKKGGWKQPYKKNSTRVGVGRR